MGFVDRLCRLTSQSHVNKLLTGNLRTAMLRTN